MANNTNYPIVKFTGNELDIKNEDVISTGTFDEDLIDGFTPSPTDQTLVNISYVHSDISNFTGGVTFSNINTNIDD